MISKWLHSLGSPKFFFEFSGKFLPILKILCVVFFGVGLVGGLMLAPPDYQQGEAVRIMYIHVPSAFLSLFAYTLMAFFSAVYLVWRIKISLWIAKSAAPIGAIFTLSALITGAIWGKPMWGAWWVWDARLTSELILLFLYLGYLMLGRAIEQPDRAHFSASLLAVVGFINIPIIHYSVTWWNTLHQGTTLSFSKPEIDASLLYPLLSMILAFFAYFGVVLLIRARGYVIKQELDSSWVRTLLKLDKAA